MEQKLRKAATWLLSLAMLTTMLPGAALAEETDGLCEHHTVHTAECGYVEGESACTYHCDTCLGHGEEEPEEPQEEAVPAGPVCVHGNSEESCAVCVAEIQAMVDALPDMEDITDENRADVISQLEAIDSCKWKLSDEASDRLDFGKYADAAFVLSAPEGFFGFVLGKV